MLDVIRKFFDQGKKEEETDETNELAIAAGALMVEAAFADETYTDKERSIITRLLQSTFDLSEDDALKTRVEAESRQADANDLHQFTKRVKSLSAETKLLLIEGLWHIALSDAARDPYEDALIRRVAGLLHISDVDSGAARQRVQASLGTSAG